jgi:hypothetical protein
MTLPPIRTGLQFRIALAFNILSVVVLVGGFLLLRLGF